MSDIDKVIDFLKSPGFVTEEDVTCIGIASEGSHLSDNVANQCKILKLDLKPEFEQATNSENYNAVIYDANKFNKEEALAAALEYVRKNRD